MEGEKLEELERALRNQLSEEKLKFIDKYRLQLNSRRRWVCKKNQTPERVYFSHKFAMDNGILEFLFRKYQFCFAKLKYFRKNLDKFSFCKYHRHKQSGTMIDFRYLQQIRQVEVFQGFIKWLEELPEVEEKWGNSLVDRLSMGLGKEHFKRYKKMIFTYFTKFYLFKIFIH